ncbi:MAG TPA: PIG-L family deacetylase [Thermoanaerobaculia bacterium]|nr:PIG-L family deacetylase [Thermoanaerobaculia bacterium]
MKRIAIILSLLLLTATAALAVPIPSATTTSAAAPPRSLDAAQIQLALKKLGGVGRALYVAAHPDDENTAMISWLTSERLLRTGYLSITRGDGGQNLIGTEKGDLLGVIRTHELLAARRIDGGEQFFTRALDFGYSKSAGETLAIWGKDDVLADVVWVIRLFRPDVIVSRFPSTGEGGHGQHTASAILAVEAFEAAGDPKRYPEQLQYVAPWKPVRILWNLFRFPGAPPPKVPEGAAIVTVDLGTYNPILGKSYSEIAGESRSMHKSQGFGAPERRGSIPNEMIMLAGTPPAGDDLFGGIDLSWKRLAGGDEVGRLLDEALRQFDPANPASVIPHLLRARAAMNRLVPRDAWSSDVLVEKQAAIDDVIRAAAGLWIESIATEASATAGSEVRIAVTAINRSEVPLRLVRVAAAGVEVKPAADLQHNQPKREELTIRLAEADYTQPYWLRREPGKGLHRVDDPTMIGQPQNRPAIPVVVEIAAGDQVLTFEVPTLYRWTDRVAGEQYRPFEIVPEVTIDFDQRAFLFPDSGPKTVHLTLRSGRTNVRGSLNLQPPAGWRVEPSTIPIALTRKNELQTVPIRITPPSSPASGTLRAESRTERETVSRSLVVIDYPHIPRQSLFPESAARLVRADVRRAGERIGYIMGAGDEVPESLRQIGFDVTLLSDEQIRSGNLGEFDAIVAGVRAYNTRDSLKQSHERLMKYVEEGGVVVVQYNTFDNTLAPQIGPYPLKLSRDRVSVEEAPVSFVASDHPILTRPNRIVPADFDGWVQERGLYFAGEWDPRYQAVIASRDPGEPDKPGGLLVANHGKGVYIYTGYAFFRQLPAGVPGAYRLFANLVSGGREARAR